MSGKDKYPSVFDQIKAGLEDSIAYSRGELSLVTTELPPPPPRQTAKSIVALRKRLKMSQAYLAAMLSVSTKTVQSWEQDVREPSDMALRLLQILDEEPGVIARISGLDRRRKPLAGRKVAKKKRGPIKKVKKCPQETH